MDSRPHGNRLAGHTGRGAGQSTGGGAASSSASGVIPREDLTWLSAAAVFFLRVASLRAPLECGGLLSWLPVFKQRPHLWRLPLQGGPQESGSRHAHLPSLHPPAQGRTGQVGPRGLTVSLAVPACGSPGGWSGALQTESARQMFVTIPDQDSGGGKGAGICDRCCARCSPRTCRTSFLLCLNHPKESLRGMSRNQV